MTQVHDHLPLAFSNDQSTSAFPISPLPDEVRFQSISQEVIDFEASLCPEDLKIYRGFKVEAIIEHKSFIDAPRIAMQRLLEGAAPDIASVLRPDAVIPTPRWDQTSPIPPVFTSKRRKLPAILENVTEVIEEKEDTSSLLASLTHLLQNAEAEKVGIEAGGRTRHEEASGSAQAIRELAQEKYAEIIETAETAASTREQQARLAAQAHEDTEKDRATEVTSVAQIQNANSFGSFAAVLANPKLYRDDHVAMANRLSQPYRGVQYEKQAERKATEIRKNAKTNAFAIIADALVENDREIQAARDRAEQLLSEEYSRANHLVEEAQARTDAELGVVNTRITELQSQIAELSSPAQATADDAKTDSFAAPAKKPAEAADKAQNVRRPESDRYMWLVAASAKEILAKSLASKKVRQKVMAGALAAVATIGVAVVAKNSGDSEADRQRLEQYAEQAVAVPKWEGFPVAIKASQEEWAKAITAINGKNYLLGDGTKQYPGRAYLLEVLELLTSKGNFHDPHGIVPLSTVNAVKLSQKYGISYKTEHTGNPTPSDNYIATPEDAQNQMVSAAENANSILSEMYKDPKWQNPEEYNLDAFDAEFLNRWEVNGANVDPKTGLPTSQPITKVVPAYSQLFVNMTGSWAKHESTNALLAEMVADSGWKKTFADAEKIVRDAKVLSPREANS